MVSGPTVLAMDEAPDDVVTALSTRPALRLLDPDALDPVLAYLVPLIFAFIFFITSQIFGLQIAQSVVEEKQTRIVEILVAAVPARALLAGKILAGTVLAFGQIALIALITVVGMRFGDSGELLSLLAPAIGWFLPFFLLGFVLLAAMWAAAGALANRQEDVSAVSTPVQIAIMAPFFAVSFLNDNPTAMTVLSYVPFSSPTAMPLRLFHGDAAGWEPLVSLALLLVGRRRVRGRRGPGVRGLAAAYQRPHLDPGGLALARDGGLTGTRAPHSCGSAGRYGATVSQSGGNAGTGQAGSGCQADQDSSHQRCPASRRAAIRSPSARMASARPG